MVLPVITLSIAPMTEVIRLMRTSTEEIISQNYIKAAAIRGLSRLTIIRRHFAAQCTAAGDPETRVTVFPPC